MNRFWPIVTQPILDMVGARSIVEIGAATGAHSWLLKRWCTANRATLHVIDPAPTFNVERFEDRDAGIHVDRRLSLEALPGAAPVDVALVDGDHNYYTVRRELEILLQNARDEDRPPPVLLCHDVGWPYGRRDLYYDPENVPAEHRQPHRMAGLVEGQSELADEGGLNANMHNAEHEGGPRNGVLTAVEDVIDASDVALSMVVLPVIYGLAIVVPAERLERHPELGPWLGRWETREGWAELARLAEVERYKADERLQKIAAMARAGDPLPPPPKADRRRPVETARGRSFRVQLPQGTLSRVQLGTLRTSYRGIPFYKNPFDVVLYQELIGRLKPATVLEIGTKDGGSATWFADQQSLHGVEPRVVTVDIEQPPALDDPRIRFLRGDALALGAVLTEELLRSLPRPWLIVEDSAHLFETSLAVLEFFHPHLHKGEYIVIEDGSLADFTEPIYEQFEDGPNRAVKHFLEGELGAAYAIDAGLCDRYGHNVTWAPNAWLRRR